jgi:hypothetical protein
MKKRNQVWVIEYKMDGKWFPDSCAVWPTKKDCQNYMIQACTDKSCHRIRKYIAEEPNA